MGERGPVSIPDARRRNKRLDTRKRVEVTAPQMPDNLDCEAAAEWERIVPEIEAMQTWFVADDGPRLGPAKPLSYSRELVEQFRAKTQFTASLRVIDSDLKMKGTLLDLMA